MERYQNEGFKRSNRIIFDFNHMMAEEAPGITEEDLVMMMMEVDDAEARMKEYAAAGRLTPSVPVEEIEKTVSAIKEHYDCVILASQPEAEVLALAHPYYNELNAEQRGGCPKVYYLGETNPEQWNRLFEVMEGSRVLFLGSKDQSMTTTYIINQIAAGTMKPADIQMVEAELYPLVIPALYGADMAEYAAGAYYMEDICDEEDTFRNPAAMLGILSHLAEGKGYTLKEGFGKNRLLIEAGPLSMEIRMKQVIPFALGQMKQLQKTADLFKQILDGKDQDPFAGLGLETGAEIEPEARFMI